MMNNYVAIEKSFVGNFDWHVKMNPINCMS